MTLEMIRQRSIEDNQLAIDQGGECFEIINVGKT